MSEPCLYTAKNNGTADVIKNVARRRFMGRIYKGRPNPTDKRVIVDSLTAVSNTKYLKPS